MEADRESARAAAAQLAIPLRDADFVHEYWNNVFRSAPGTALLG